MGGVCGGVVATEVCAPLLLLCWLCCWPDDTNSDSSSNDGKHPKKPLVNTHEGSTRSNHSNLFNRRHVTSSAVSLHLPSTSGKKQPLSAHRSHEEIPSRRKSHAAEDESRYHSAPSVIDEILHRRDWERSTKELYIPLNPDRKRIEENVICKKHHTNIKSSKNKESNNNDIKDVDTTESTFYIGDNDAKVLNNNDEKQCINEYIKVRENKESNSTEVPTLNFCVDEIEEMDRSGAMHREVGSSFSLLSLAKSPGKPPSVEAVGYEGGACYLAEVDKLSCLRSDVTEPSRARHASDGDILASHHRPESGAFSESDLELELKIKEEKPPDYEELQLHTNSARETAI